MHIARTLFGVLIFLMLSMSARAADVTVFAAASLSDALPEIQKSYQVKTHRTVAFSFASSSVLARQIENATGADIFISADTDWMDELDRKGLIRRATRRNILGNHLVLISPAAEKRAIRIAPHFDLIGALHGGRLAMANTDSVPAGKYGKAALMALGVWEAVAWHLAQAENVRAALAFVARGEAPLGIVYTSDALAEPRVRIVGTFLDSTHPPIVYPAALVKEARPAAKAFLDYLSGHEARAVVQKDGFVVLGAR